MTKRILRVIIRITAGGGGDDRKVSTNVCRDVHPQDAAVNRVSMSVAKRFPWPELLPWLELLPGPSCRCCANCMVLAKGPHCLTSAYYIASSGADSHFHAIFNVTISRARRFP